MKSKTECRERTDKLIISLRDLSSVMTCQTLQSLGRQYWFFILYLYSLIKYYDLPQFPLVFLNKRVIPFLEIAKLETFVYVKTGNYIKK